MKHLSRIAGIVLTLVLMLSLIPAGSVWAEPAADAEITVTISVAGEVKVAAKQVTVKDKDGDGALTIDEALYAAHEAYYPGGAAAGYASAVGDYGLGITMLWGDESKNFGYYNNGEMSWGAADPVAAGDYLTAFVYKNADFSDAFSKFDKVSYTGKDSITASLQYVGSFDETWQPVFAPLGEAAVTVYDENHAPVKPALYTVTDNGDGTYKVEFAKSGKYLIQADKADPLIIPAVACADITVDVTKASVDFTAQAEGAFLFAPQTGVEVSSDLAESYGFADQTRGQVSVLDVLVKAHELAFGEAFTPAAAEDYLVIGTYGSPNKQFGIGYDTYYGGFFLNHALANDGTKWDEDNYNGTSVSTQAVKSGDLVEFFFYEDPYMGDSYNWFVDADENYSRSFTVNENTDLVLTLKSFFAMNSSIYKDEAEMVAGDEASEAGDAQIYIVDTATGALTPIAGAVTDEDDGSVTISFEDPGPYTICAYGTEDSMWTQILTLTTITVNDIPDAADADITATISVAGDVKLPAKAVTVKDVNGDGVLTIDEALYAAHEAYYEGGAAAGYASANTAWGLSVATLWGDASGNYGYYNNGNMSMGAADPVAAGDYLSAFVYKDGANWSDIFSKFDALTYSGDNSVTVTLQHAGSFDNNWQPVFTPLSGATITVFSADYAALDASDYTVTDNEDGTYKVEVTKGGSYIIQADNAEPFIVPALAKADITVTGTIEATDKNGDTVLVTLADPGEDALTAKIDTETAAAVITGIVEARDTETIADDIATPATVNDAELKETSASDLVVIRQFDLSVPTGAAFPLTMTFDVPEVQDDQPVFVYHYNGTKWELVGSGLGKSVKATFDSLSPVAIVAAAAPPATGDVSMMPWIALCAASIVVAAATVLYCRKRREE